MNEQVVSWHLLEDVLGWAAVFIGALVMHFTGWTWIDPLLALGMVEADSSIQQYDENQEQQPGWLEAAPLPFERPEDS